MGFNDLARNFYIPIVMFICCCISCIWILDTTISLPLPLNLASSLVSNPLAPIVVGSLMMFKVKLFCNYKSLPPWILQSCTTQSMPWIPNIFKVLPNAYPFPTFEVDLNSILSKNPKLTKNKIMQTLKLSTPNTTSFKCLAQNKF